MIGEIGRDLLFTKITRPHKALMVNFSPGLLKTIDKGSLIICDNTLYRDVAAHRHQGGGGRILPPVRRHPHHRRGYLKLRCTTQGPEHAHEVSLGINERSIKAVEQRTAQM